MTHDEQADADYLRRSIDSGNAHIIMDMVREMDDIVKLLGIEDSHDSVIDVLRAHPDWQS